MKKMLISVLGLVALSGCAYDYYQGGVRYVQDGTDCIYYSGEQGRRFSDDVSAMRTGKKVVYRNTICANLYDQDTNGQPARQDRQILAPAAVEQTYSPCDNGGCMTQSYAPTYYTYKSGCAACSQPVPVQRKFYVVSGS